VEHHVEALAGLIKEIAEHGVVTGEVLGPGVCGQTLALSSQM